jgi:hypothetical protein
MKAWIKLALGVLGGVAPEALLALVVDALFEDNNDISPKLDALIQEPYKTAARFLADAKATNSASYRFQCLRTARESFIKAYNLEAGLSIFDSVSPAESTLMAMRAQFPWDRHPVVVTDARLNKVSKVIRASYYAGVCADLLGERGVALRDYESAYSTALIVESQLRSADVNYGDNTLYSAGCVTSRRELLATVIRGLSENAQSSQMHDRNEALTLLYSIVRPISDLLYRRGSHLKGLVPSRELDVLNRDNATRAVERFYDATCRPASKWFSDAR